MQVYGNCGRSARHYSTNEASILDGLLFGDDKPEIAYPSDYATAHDRAKIDHLSEHDWHTEPEVISQ